MGSTSRTRGSETGVRPRTGKKKSAARNGHGAARIYGGRVSVAETCGRVGVTETCGRAGVTETGGRVSVTETGGRVGVAEAGGRAGVAETCAVTGRRDGVSRRVQLECAG